MFSKIFSQKVAFFSLLFFFLFLSACKQKKTLKKAKPFILELYKSRSFYEADSIYRTLKNKIISPILLTTRIDTQGIWHHVFSEGYKSFETCLGAKIGYEDKFGFKELLIHDYRTLKAYQIKTDTFSTQQRLTSQPQLFSGLDSTLNHIPYIKNYNLDKVLLFKNFSTLNNRFYRKTLKNIDLPRGIYKHTIQKIIDHGLHIHYFDELKNKKWVLTVFKIKKGQDYDLALYFSKKILQAGYYEEKHIDTLESSNKWIKKFDHAYKVYIKSNLKKIDKYYYIFSNSTYLIFLEEKNKNHSQINTLISKNKNINDYKRFRDSFYVLPLYLEKNMDFCRFEFEKIRGLKDMKSLYLNGSLKSQVYFYDVNAKKLWQNTTYKFYVPANARHIYEAWYSDKKAKPVEYRQESAKEHNSKVSWSGLAFETKRKDRLVLVYRIEDHIFTLANPYNLDYDQKTWLKKAETWQF